MGVLEEGEAVVDSLDRPDKGEGEGEGDHLAVVGLSAELLLWPSRPLGTGLPSLELALLQSLCHPLHKPLSTTHSPARVLPSPLPPSSLSGS